MCIEAKKGVGTLYWTNYIKFLQNNQHKFAEKWNRFRKNGAGFSDKYVQWNQFGQLKILSQYIYNPGEKDYIIKTTQGRESFSPITGRSPPGSARSPWESPADPPRTNRKGALDTT